MYLKFLVTSLSLVVFGSFSAQANEGKMAERKAKVTAHLDQKISLLNEFKSCVQAASAKGDIKKCRQAHKPKMEALRNEKKAMRAERKAKRAERKNRGNR